MPHVRSSNRHVQVRRTARQRFGAPAVDGRVGTRPPLRAAAHKLALEQLLATAPDGATISELSYCLELGTHRTGTLLDELKCEGRVALIGHARASRWILSR